jgi:hypothetical protein
MAPRTILGLELGQAQQFSALAAVRESGQDAEGHSVWAVPALTRWRGPGNAGRAEENQDLRVGGWYTYQPGPR